MTTFAEGTSVSVSKTRMEIESLLLKWKATKVGVMTEPERAYVLFAIGKWSVQFIMPLPTKEEAQKALYPRATWKGVTEEQRAKWIDQRNREKWRALLLTIKAKLVSVENGVETFEEAFLAHLVLADGGTVGQKALPALRQSSAQGQLPMLSAGAPQ